MIKPAQITSDEKALLENWRRYGVNPLIRDRALSILLNTRGSSANKIALDLSRDPDTVRSWLSSFKQRGLSSLFTKHRGNTNASKLAWEQKQEIKKVLSQSPSQYGIPKQFWQILNSKLEVREYNLGFRILLFEFVSNLEIRISSFEFNKVSLLHIFCRILSPDRISQLIKLLLYPVGRPDST
jgi:transposase